MAKTKAAALVVIFHPDPESAGYYGILDCSWEKARRTTLISEPAARKFAEGWKAEFVVKGVW